MEQAAIANVVDVPVLGSRHPLDAYYTPQPLADAVVRWLAADFIFGEGPSIVLEPSIGAGAFALAAKAQWPLCEVDGVDVNPDAAGLRLCTDVYVQDFVTVSMNRTPCLTIGNPPFSFAEEHAAHANELTPGGIVALLLRSAFFHGKKREAFWKKYPARKEYRLVERPSFTGGGTDSAEYSVFVWTPGRPVTECVTVRRSWK
jgi:hypothetical protein